MSLKINGESFQVSDSHRQRDATQVALEVAGREAGEIRLVDLGEEDPAGRYRLRSVEDKLLLQRATTKTPDGEYLWPSAKTLMEWAQDEASFKVPIDLTSLGGFTAMLIDTLPLEAVDTTWLGEGYGPSEIPAGWFSFLADGEAEPVYVPFWRS